MPPFTVELALKVRDEEKYQRCALINGSFKRKFEPDGVHSGLRGTITVLHILTESSQILEPASVRKRGRLEL